MEEKLKVGYIGLGLMGKSIARNIMKAGFPLVVHNRSQASVKSWCLKEPMRLPRQQNWQLKWM
jgi:3-hydroxyisobutyrate dehydrogenase-like beta-hydroxyacid dehydrogenase